MSIANKNPLKTYPFICNISLYSSLPFLGGVSHIFDHVFIYVTEYMHHGTPTSGAIHTPQTAS